MSPRRERQAECHPERRHESRGLCRQCYNKLRYVRHLKEEKARNAAYYAAHREERIAHSVAYKAGHREEVAVYNAAYIAARKLEALNAYGGPVCVCCGETLIQGLSIDHVKGDGAAHRKTVTSGPAFYRWLKEHNYPPGYQVLCFTCNFAKAVSDHCPHREVYATIAESWQAA